MENITGKLIYIFQRLREPSSHAAISALLALAGLHIPSEVWATIFNGGAIIFGIAGVFVKEAQPQTRIEGFSK